MHNYRAISFTLAAHARAVSNAGSAGLKVYNVGPKFVGLGDEFVSCACSVFAVLSALGWRYA